MKTSTLPTFSHAADLSSFDVPMATYLMAQPTVDAVAVGALVFHPTTAAAAAAATTADPRLLIVRRAPTDSMPLRWETPGGACDPEDASILHGLGRELWEESGLVLRSAVAVVGGARMFFTRRGLRVCKFSFEVEVQGSEDGQVPAVTLEPSEHVEHLWATEEECRARRAGEAELVFTTEDQEAVILEGFKLWKERRDVLLRRSQVETA